jgi:hypothetical protein
VGRFAATSRATGALGQYLLGFIKPETAYAVMENINARLSRGAVLKTKSIGPGKLEAKVILNPGVEEKPYSMSVRLGTMSP